MYSGLTITRLSGSILGAHQKIDRVARRHIEQLDPHCRFPDINAILHFEGVNGPDAIKRKSPSKDEPWHFLQPFDNKDTQLIDIINQHYKQLVTSLKKGDQIRAAFDSAWLAHAIVDGLTPAHHYPYEEKLEELRSGRDLSTRKTLKDRWLMDGDKKSHRVKNNWKMWGPKGLIITHAGFELGVATLIAPLGLRQARFSFDDVASFQQYGLTKWYRDHAKDVAKLGLYDKFYDSGWTTELARIIRRQLAPMLVKAVSVTWYAAIEEANRAKPHVVL